MVSRGKESDMTEHLTHTHTHTPTPTRGVKREEMKGGHEEVGVGEGLTSSSELLSTGRWSYRCLGFVLIF